MYMRQTAMLSMPGCLLLTDNNSNHETTQGDPPSGAFYTIDLQPLVLRISAATKMSSKHVAYADDLTGGGKLRHLRDWFDSIIESGPMHGYYAEPTKRWLIVKENLEQEAADIFEGVGVNITTSGKKHFGAVIGTLEYNQEFISNLVMKWVDQIPMLSKIVAFEPQSAYAAFTTCLRHRYTFYMRTVISVNF